MTITADDREKWAVSNVATVVEQRNKSRNRHKPSAATHHDYNHRVLFPGPRLHQGREQDAAKHQPSATSNRRDGAAATARWVRPMMTAIER